MKHNRQREGGKWEHTQKEVRDTHKEREREKQRAEKWSFLVMQKVS